MFTDVVGSTQLWDAHDSTMDSALAAHDRILRSAIERESGYVFSTQGDAFAAAFHSVAAAIRCAVAIQSSLGDHQWPDDTPIRARIGIHLGEAHERDGDYFGPTVNRAARVMDAGHGSQILISDVARRMHPQIDAVDLGHHRLKGLAEPEHIWQVNVPGAASQFPPLRSSHATANNLPAQRTELLGRAAETAEIVGLLADHRLVTLTGFGGTGKTRLAVAVAAAVAHDFPRGVFFVDLAPVTDGSRVGIAAAEAAGMSAESLSGDGPIHERAARALAGQDLLLVLDNCEHLINDVIDYLDHLLDLSGTPKILATSREALEIDGERQFRVRPFALDDVEASHAAVELFAQRAAAVGYQADPGDPNVASICRQLDGLPLAIELAAARTSLLSPDELSKRLGRQVDVLSSRRRLRGRHRSLEAVLDWSWNLLDPDAQELLVQLGIFSGGWTLPAAEAVCDEPATVAERLQTLVSCSLVEPVDTPSATRFRMLEPVRQFSVSHLARRPDAERLRTRHVEWLLRSASTMTYGEQCTSADWAMQVHTDLENRLAAVDAVTSRGELAVAAELMGSVTAASFDGWRSVAELDLVFETILGSLDRPPARVLLAAAFNDISTARHARLTERASRALRTAGEDGDDSCEAIARSYVAYSTAVIDPAAARRDSRLAVEQARRIGDDDIESLTLAWAGAVAFIDDDRAAALDHFHDALQIAGGRRSLAALHAHLGTYFVTLESDGEDPMPHVMAVIDQSSAMGHAKAATIFPAFHQARTGDLDALAALLDTALRMHHDYGVPNPVADAGLAVAEALGRAGRQVDAGRVVAALYRQPFTMPFIYRRYRTARDELPEGERPARRLGPDELHQVAAKALASAVDHSSGGG